MWSEFRRRASQDRTRYVHRPSMYLVILLIAGALGATYRCGQIVEADKAYNLARATGEGGVARSDQITPEDVAQSSASYGAVRFWNNVMIGFVAAAAVVVALNAAAPILFRASPSPSSGPPSTTT